jgi:predicted RND superfamily exporter protein
LRTQPEVVHVYSFTDTLKSINQQMNGGEISRYQLPEERALSAQYMLLYELSLPYGLDVNTLVSIDKSAYRIFIALKSVSSKTMLELEQRFNNYLATNTNGFNFSGASPNLIFAHIGLNNSYSMLIGMALAIALITFILIFAFRSFSYGCMSILPNLMPALIAFGIWGLFSGEVGISIASALGLTIGIVVDDTVHFVSKYLTLRRKEGLMPEAAIKQTFEHVGTALCVTSFVLIAGFLVFTTSSYSMNSDLGYFVAMTIGFALLIDLFFLAPLILLVEEYKTKNNSSEVHLDSSQSINNN